MDRKKIFIIDNYKNIERVLNGSELKNSYLKKKDLDVLFLSFKSPTNSCGDEIEFLVLKKNNEIKEIKFSNENCCIITGAAANIASSYLENSILSHKNSNSFVSNVESMIKGEEYSREEVREFEFFKEIESFNERSDCLMIIVRFVKRIFNDFQNEEST